MFATSREIARPDLHHAQIVPPAIGLRFRPERCEGCRRLRRRLCLSPGGPPRLPNGCIVYLGTGGHHGLVFGSRKAAWQIHLIGGQNKVASPSCRPFIGLRDKRSEYFRRTRISHAQRVPLLQAPEDFLKSKIDLLIPRQAGALPWLRPVCGSSCRKHGDASRRHNRNTGENPGSTHSSHHFQARLHLHNIICQKILQKGARVPDKARFGPPDAGTTKKALQPAIGHWP